ncbi:GIY-YIG nuclease family protein [Kocuria sp. 2SI]|uniref:GIY-YIG nuclease family protein n=1 Tax=Kocuria sp. 2SI TaxID=2502203 RepID=UPI00201E52C5|nr:GIY-YIG nuclease family protein [Kocuria sp. 2SI]
MTGSEGSVVPFTIERMPFTAQAIDRGGLEMEMFRDWPIVYLLDDARRVYVGESLHGVSRMRQHQASEAKQGMRTLRLVLSEMFNKSVCLDLESTLIRLFQGDGSFHVVNRNIGIGA